MDCDHRANWAEYLALSRVHTGWSLTEIRRLTARERHHLLEEAAAWMERMNEDAP